MSDHNELEFQSLQLMGLFLGVFGIIMIFAVIFPETMQGKLTNLVVGIVLLGIGLGAVLKGRSQSKKEE
ncbi:hypothetical protein KAS50_10120 [bacterium]|nr:hypothetical protein [bacterium]